MKLLSATNICKKYGSKTILDNISFDLEQGKILGLLGINGAGKTTLIRIITQILNPDSGKIFFKNNPIDLSHQQFVGYLPEERGLYKKMPVFEHLVYLARLKNMTKTDAQQATKFWLEKFEIAQSQKMLVEQLSKGMQQKVQFIAAVISKPDLLILDEPFSGLDPINSALIKNEILQLKAKGVAIIFSTHLMESVEELCDEVMIIHQHKIAVRGDKSEVLKAENEAKLSMNEVFLNAIQ